MIYLWKKRRTQNGPPEAFPLDTTMTEEQQTSDPNYTCIDHLVRKSDYVVLDDFNIADRSSDSTSKN